MNEKKANIDFTAFQIKPFFTKFRIAIIKTNKKIDFIILPYVNILKF